MNKRMMALLMASFFLASCGTPPTTPPDTGHHGGNPPGGGTPPGNGDDNPGAPTGDPVPASLQGEWHFGYISPIEYYDPSSGKYAEASGTSAIMQLNPNGTFKWTGINVTTVGVCSTKLFVQRQGVVKFDHSQSRMNLVDTTAYAEVLDTCTGRVTKGGTPSTSTSTWAVEGEGDSAVLNLAGASGASDRWNRPRAGGAPGSGHRLSGTLTAPSGHSLFGTVVIACPKATGCANAGDKFRFFKTGSEINATTWTLEGLSNEEYLVYAWQDLDNDNAFSVGDYVDNQFGQGKPTFVNPTVKPNVHFVLSALTE